MEEKSIYIRKKYDQAMAGRRLFIAIKEKLQLSLNDYIVVLADDYEKLNYVAISNIEVLQKKKYADRVIILTDKDYDVYWGNDKILYKISTDDLLFFLQYYKLLSFFSNIIVVSIKEPFASAGIIGKKGITLEDYIKDGVFV